MDDSFADRGLCSVVRRLNLRVRHKCEPMTDSSLKFRLELLNLIILTLLAQNIFQRCLRYLNDLRSSFR